MTITPTRSRLSIPMSAMDVAVSERELFEQLTAALAPSFVLVRRLGAGGMGIVFLARDPALKRLVAVKVMSPERATDPEARARFEREAESVAAISHPNVVAVYSVGELKNGLPYLVMQYVDGPSMAERLKEEGPLDLESSKQILGQVASALGAAHRKGIIHRDIKAANILWDDAAGRALVSDFGIAAVLAPEIDGELINLTQTGMVMGTPRYMSPEQLLSEPVTDKTDIYSFGLLGYELLTGEGPYSVTSPNQMVAAHLRDVPRPLSVMRPDADPELESLLAACLEKDAHGRPSAEDVARRLQHGASILLEWPPPGLEELQGAIGRPLAAMLPGAFALAIPLTIAATVERGNILRPGMPGLLAFPSVAAIGGIAVAIASVDMLRIFRVAVRAARAGYGWGIIGEVLADTEKDTGALISGEREYAALTSEQRTILRRGRVQRVGLKLLASIWAVGGFFVALPFAVRIGGSGFLALWTLGVPLAMLVAARGLLRREIKLLRPIRSRIRSHRAPLDRLSHLADTWRDSFDRLLAGVGLGHGTIGRVKRRVVGTVAVAGVVALGTIAAYAMVMTSVVGEMSMSSQPNYANIQDRATQIARLRDLRAPVDRSITPLRAGYALQSLSNAGRTRELGPLETPTKYPLGQDIVYDANIRIPFGGDWLDGRAVRQAATHLSAEQRARLEKLAAQPGGPEFSMLAHAGSIDWITASMVQPFPAGTTPWAIPILRFGPVRAEGNAHIARAILALADHKPAEAERLLRENIGVGFALTESQVLIDNLIGMNVIRAARSQLVALYEVTGRVAEARLISAERDPAQNGMIREADLATMDPYVRESYVQSMIREDSRLRGVRWGLAETYVPYQPCGDLRQVLFGPDPAYFARLAEARKALVRTPGEDQFMQLAEHALETPMSSESVGNPSVGHRAIMGFAKAVDALTGSRRMQSCVMIAVSSR